jgi:tetratricopeptide (TPR) repeat protein
VDYAESPASLGGDSSKQDRTGEKRLFSFANSLYRNGNYSQANTEYRRLLSYYPETAFALDAVRGVFFCSYGEEQYLDAVHWGLENLAMIRDSKYESELTFYIGASYFKLKNYVLAANYLQESMNVGGEYSEKSILLSGLTRAHESNWREAEYFFSKVEKKSRYWPNAQNDIRLCRDGSTLDIKSPLVAGLLSIIPGAGYLYAGYKQTALASLIVNGLFGYATYQAFEQDNEGLGALLGIVSFGWYTGNIYGSVISAQRHNLKVRKDLLIEFDLGYKF